MGAGSALWDPPQPPALPSSSGASQILNPTTIVGSTLGAHLRVSSVCVQAPKSTKGGRGLQLMLAGVTSQRGVVALNVELGIRAAG